MPPKRNAKKKLSDDYESLGEESDADFVSEPEEDISSEDEKPKKKGKAAAKKPPAKKGAAGPAKKKAKKNEDEDDSEEDDDFDSEFDDSEDEKPKKKAAPKKTTPAKKAAPKGKKLTEPTELADGFTAEPPSLLYKQFGEPVASGKIAGFDLDGTLLSSKSGLPYMVDEHDWQLYNSKVVDKLKQYHADGYKIVIFTNQGSIQTALDGTSSQKIRNKISGFVKMAGVPALVMVATARGQDPNRKPESGMWDFMCQHLVGSVQPDLASSFFVGDDLEGADSGFANAVGLPFRTEKEEFGSPEVIVGAGAGGVGAGAVATGSIPNAELVGQFRALADQLRKSGEKSAGFAANAMVKVAKELEQLTYKITSSHLKEISNIKGVGKGSIEKIKAYLATGSILTEGEGSKPPEGRVAKATDNKARESAMQFL